MNHPTIRWVGDERGHAELIDQTLLPAELRYAEIRTKEEMWDAIRRLAIRGAPAIGVGAAFGVVLGLQERDVDDRDAFAAHFEAVAAHLATARPTAVNLFWALDRLRAFRSDHAGEEPCAQRRLLFEEALRMLEEDAETCRLLGRHGAELVDDGDTLLTHCNAGALATAGSGTALAVMYAAQERGRRFTVYADETRPLLQGARLTSWELMQAGIDVTLICDNMAGHVMRTRGVSKVFVGADRIAANGDAANKIGTYPLAVLARRHGVPFYVAAPLSTFDPETPSGAEIPIEERDAAEVTAVSGTRLTPAETEALNLAFDVTPAELVTAFITDAGVLEPPYEESIARALVAVEGG